MIGALAAPEPRDRDADRADRDGALLVPATVIAEIAEQVTRLAPLPADRLPEWCQDLAVPEGWLATRVDGRPQVARIALFGPTADASWTAAETISVFQFSGHVPADVIEAHNDKALRDLHAESVTTYRLDVPSDAAVTAVRSTGYFTAMGKRAWGQCTTYVEGARRTGVGLLIEQVIFVDAAWRARLREDIAELADTVHEAFLTYLDTVEDDIDSPLTTEVPCDGA